MMVLRMFVFLLTLFCLVVSFHRGQFDGVSLLGLGSFAVLLWTLGFFTRAFWVQLLWGDEQQEEELARLDRELDRRENS